MEARMLAASESRRVYQPLLSVACQRWAAKTSGTSVVQTAPRPKDASEQPTRLLTLALTFDTITGEAGQHHQVQASVRRKGPKEACTWSGGLLPKTEQGPDGRHQAPPEQQGMNPTACQQGRKLLGNVAP